MKSIISLVIIIYSGILFLGMSTASDKKKWKTYIAPSEQRTGDPDKGYEYLRHGNYVSSGIPTKFFPNRDSTNLGVSFTRTKHANGTDIIAPNCFTCHADYINGELVLGLGNHSFDYTQNLTGPMTLMSMMIRNSVGKESKEWAAYESFKKSSSAINPNIITQVRGINPADKLTSVLVAHRDPASLIWHDTTLLDIPKETTPTDVPPWWVFKKKNAMFYTAIGRGDFSRFLMASSLLTVSDTTEAKEIDQHFPDVLSWIKSIEPPAYPKEINQELAQEGQIIFNKTCSKCHGTYGDDESYPNLLIALDKVGTDATLSNAYTQGTYQNFIDWYNKSWFVTGDTPGKLVIESGYVAQPLDGIWASAPYLHNGSIPTIEALLNSKSRPTYWKRTYDSKDYDWENLGWLYTTPEYKEDHRTYDTTIDGYKNTGHTFGDHLTDSERMAVIEYLKTI